MSAKCPCINNKQDLFDTRSDSLLCRIRKDFLEFLASLYDKSFSKTFFIFLFAGILSVKPEPVKLDRHLVKGSVRLLVSSLHNVLKRSADWLNALTIDTSCWVKPTLSNKNFSEMYAK